MQHSSCSRHGKPTRTKPPARRRGETTDRPKNAYANGVSVVDTGGFLINLRTVPIARKAYFMAKAHLQLVTPTIVKQTVSPQRKPNSNYRTREHLTEAEIEKLIAATKDNRHK